MELTDRKKKILRAIVESYIQEAEPVGSKSLAAMPDLNYSSATIRNEMADLTTMGYLEQPHTSAGRIPSPAGYRLYIDELMQNYRLSVDETHSLNEAMLEEGKNNYFACIYGEGDSCGLSFCDVSTGAFYATCLQGGDLSAKVLSELGRFSPSEVVRGGMVSMLLINGSG